MKALLLMRISCWCGVRMIVSLPQGKRTVCILCTYFEKKGAEGIKNHNLNQANRIHVGPRRERQTPDSTLRKRCSGCGTTRAGEQAKGIS